MRRSRSINSNMRLDGHVVFAPLLVALLLVLISSVDTIAADEEINWQVISSGGTDGQSATYKLKGTVAQTAVGTGTTDGFGLNHGFWQEFVQGTGCCGIFTGGITGNTNCSSDGKLTLSDITRLIDEVYISKAPLCCAATGNTNGSVDCKHTLSDITKLIDAVYISKTPPEACMPSCEE